MAPSDVESAKLRPDLIVRSSQTKGRPSGAPRSRGASGASEPAGGPESPSSAESRATGPPHLFRKLLKPHELNDPLLKGELEVLADERAVDVLLHLLDEAVELGRRERWKVGSGSHEASLRRRAAETRSPQQLPEHVVHAG
jgi:hypothetical protein